MTHVQTLVGQGTWRCSALYQVHLHSSDCSLRAVSPSHHMTCPTLSRGARAAPVRRPRTGPAASAGGLPAARCTQSPFDVPYPVVGQQGGAGRAPCQARAQVVHQLRSTYTHPLTCPTLLWGARAAPAAPGQARAQVVHQLRELSLFPSGSTHPHPLTCPTLSRGAQGGGGPPAAHRASRERRWSTSCASAAPSTAESRGAPIPAGANASPRRSAPASAQCASRKKGSSISGSACARGGRRGSVCRAAPAVRGSRGARAWRARHEGEPRMLPT